MKDLRLDEDARMPVKRSAGVLLWRREAGRIEVLLALPGGPYTRGKGAGAWQIPKGQIEEDEDALTAAMREFAEETGLSLSAPPVPLGAVRQKGGKLVEAFALEGAFDPATLVSNSFELEWPPRCGTMQSFPELAEVAWFALPGAREHILPSQAPLIDMLEALLGKASTE